MEGYQGARLLCPLRPEVAVSYGVEGCCSNMRSCLDRRLQPGLWNNYTVELRCLGARHLCRPPGTLHVQVQGFEGTWSVCLAPSGVHCGIWMGPQCQGYHHTAVQGTGSTSPSCAKAH